MWTRRTGGGLEVTSTGFGARRQRQHHRGGLRPGGRGRESELGSQRLSGPVVVGHQSRPRTAGGLGGVLERAVGQAGHPQTPGPVTAVGRGESRVVDAQTCAAPVLRTGDLENDAFDPQTMRRLLVQNLGLHRVGRAGALCAAFRRGRRGQCERQRAWIGGGRPCLPLGQIQHGSTTGGPSHRLGPLVLRSGDRAPIGLFSLFPSGGGSLVLLCRERGHLGRPRRGELRDAQRIGLAEWAGEGDRCEETREQDEPGHDGHTPRPLASARPVGASELGGPSARFH